MEGCVGREEEELLTLFMTRSSGVIVSSFRRSWM